MGNKYYTQMRVCKLCGSKDLTEVFKLEEQYLSPTFVKTNKNNQLSRVKVPMTMILCDKSKNRNNCGLLQLKEVVQPDLLYRNYFYRSATSGIMRRDLKEFVSDVLSHIKLGPKDIIIDIGANDCTTLSYFPDTALRIGVEPAKNIDWGHVDPSIAIVNDYFAQNSVTPIMRHQKAKIITATAMFYDLEEPNKIVEQIKNVLAPDGILVLQLSYLVLMIKNMNFYDICNEHLSYYSLQTLSALMKRHDLKIVDASTNPVNGGSIRVYITHTQNRTIKTNTKALKHLMAEEKKLKLFEISTYKKFYARMVELGTITKNYILEEKKKNGLVIGLGASTKGNVLLQFFGIDKKLLPYISERNPDKVSLRTMGTDIELISEDHARSLKPTGMLVLPWYFKEEIVKREKDYLAKGGALLFPMPYPHIVTKSGETKMNKK